MILDGVQRGHELRTRADPHVVSEGDRRVVHEESIGIDERVPTEDDIAPVGALEARHDERALSGDCHQGFECASARLLIAAGNGVERVEQDRAFSSSFPQLVVIEVPLATGKTIRLLTHGTNDP